MKKALFFAQLPVANICSVHVRCIMEVGFRWFTALDNDLLKMLGHETAFFIQQQAHDTVRR